MPRTARQGSVNGFTVAHLTTIDLSLRYLLLAQLRAVRDVGGVAIGISAPGPHVSALEAEGIRHIPLESSTRAANPLADARAAGELLRSLRREQIDVLHTHNPKPGVYGRIVGRLAHVPIVVNTVHGLYATDDDPLAKRALVYGLEGIASRFSDAELFQNPEDLALMRRFHVARNASLLGNGIDISRFERNATTEEARAVIRSEIGAGTDTVVVGCVGRLVAEKGYPELFEAMSALDPSRYLLVVAGTDDPDKPDALERATVEAARAQGVKFLGHRDDVQRIYAALDILVLASHREGFPRAPMEAAAMGVPAIVTDVRGCREVVENGRTGLVVPARDPERLRHAIVTLGENAGLRTTYGNASRAKAQQEFDERDVVDRVFRTYLHVAKRHKIRLGPLAEHPLARDNHSP